MGAKPTREEKYQQLKAKTATAAVASRKGKIGQFQHVS